MSAKIINILQNSSLFTLKLQIDYIYCIEILYQGANGSGRNDGWWSAEYGSGHAKHAYADATLVIYCDFGQIELKTLFCCLNVFSFYQDQTHKEYY